MIKSGYQSIYMSSNGCEALPVCDVWADFTPGLLSVAAAGFFRTTRPPRAPRPPRVSTLLSQLSTLARFTPAAEVSYKQAKKKIYCVKKTISSSSPSSSEERYFKATLCLTFPLNYMEEQF